MLKTYKFAKDIQDKSIAVAPKCLSYLVSDKNKLSFCFKPPKEEEYSFHQYAQKVTPYIVDFRFHIFSFELKLTPILEKFIVASFKGNRATITLSEGFDDLTELNVIKLYKFDNFEIIVNSENNVIINIIYLN